MTVICYVEKEYAPAGQRMEAGTLACTKSLDQEQSIRPRELRRKASEVGPGKWSNEISVNIEHA